MESTGNIEKNGYLGYWVQETKVGRKSFKYSIRGPVVDHKYACLVYFPIRHAFEHVNQ